MTSWGRWVDGAQMQNADPGEVGVLFAQVCESKLHRPHPMMVMPVMVVRFLHDATLSQGIFPSNANGAQNASTESIKFSFNVK